MSSRKQALTMLNKTLLKGVLMSSISIPLFSFAADKADLDIQYSTPDYGYQKDTQQETTVKEKTEEELLIEKLYTPHEEYQLPERLHEYEEPESTDEKYGERLNAGIPTVVSAIYKRKSKQEDLTKEIGSNIENTQQISSVIDLDEYLDMDAVEERKEAQKSAERYLNGEVTREEVEGQLEDIVFPVTTDLKPMRMPAARMELSPTAKAAVTTPMVFIGMDEYSLSWLKMNLTEIEKFDAPIFVTQVDSLEDLQQLKRITPDSKLVPVRGDEALETYGVDFYPVMITKDGIFQ